MFSIKGRIFQQWGWDPKKWDDMELDAKNGMKQVEYCYEGFDNKTLFLYFLYIQFRLNFFTVIL